jgi:protein involved in polysaccharide export with SLBB domain
MDRHSRTSTPSIHPVHGWRLPTGWVAILAIAVITLNPLVVLAQPGGASAGLIKPGDVLDLRVPGRPDLSLEMIVDADGNVTVPQVGEVEVEGLDLATATTVLKQKIRLFVPTLDSLSLELIAGSGNPRVYVIGQVVNPGAHTFTTIPSLWDLLRAAGGPSPGADLRDARIIREVDDLPEVLPVDLSGVLEGTALPDLQLRDGDTLIVPRLAEGVSGVPSEDGVKVFGAVGVPTVVAMREPLPLLDVVMLAGAPQAEAKLEEVHWVHHEGGRIQSTVVDVKTYLLLGDPLGNPLIYPGDTLMVTYQKPSWVRANVPWILGSLAALATVLLAIDRLYFDN